MQQVRWRRQWERQRNSLQSKLRYRRARFAEWTLHIIPASEPQKYKKRETQKALLLEEIQKLEADLQKVTLERKKTPNHILWKDLPEKDKFSQPVLGRKRLMDAVRMIAYRAETAMCALLTSSTLDTAAARRVLQDLFVTEADLRPDPARGILHVEVHRGSRPAVDRILSELFSKLNEMEFKFPGTELQLHYQLLGDDSAVPDELASRSVPGGKEF